MVLITISKLAVRLILLDLKYSLTLLLSVAEKSSFVLENVSGANFNVDGLNVIVVVKVNLI